MLLATNIFEHVSQGLSAAHVVGVVHRDIKPANIFLASRDGAEDVRACVLDFGVSKHRSADASLSSQGLTGTADTLGSIGYMAPEQIGAAADADARADLYAAAGVLFRMLTGAMPFRGRSTATMLIAKLNDAPLRLAEVTGIEWPFAVEAFFRRGLARDPEGRFPSGAAMLDAWQEAIAKVTCPDWQAFAPAVMRDHDPEDFRAENDSFAGSTVQT